jgi:hypothetical protein
LQKKIERQISIKKPFLNFNFQSDTGALKFGQEAKFKIDYHNTSDIILENIFFKIIPGAGDFLVKDIIIDDFKNSRLVADTVYLNPVGAQESGSLDFKIIFGEIERKTNQTAYFRYEMNYKAGENLFVHSAYSPKIKILSDLDPRAAGYYYSQEGDQLGIGPLPPKIGIPTTYWIKFDISNFGNDISKAVFSAKLSPDIVLTENKSVSSGRLVFGRISDAIIWEMNNIEKENDYKSAWFEVSFNPDRKDMGKEKILITNINYSAFDEFSQELIEGKLENITTNLKHDLLAADKGIVGE